MSSSLATPTLQENEASGGILLPGIQQKSKKRENFEKLLIGIREYECIYGDMLVPQRFVIPSNTSEWPEAVWDMKLGRAVDRIRNAGQNKEYHDELREVGFDFNCKATRSLS